MSTGADIFVGVVAVYLMVSLGIGMVDTTPPWRFVAGGVATVLCDSMLTLVAAWLLALLAARRDAVWGVASVLLAATVATALVVHWPLAQAISALAHHDHGVLALLLELVSRGWWFFVLLAFAHWLAPRGLLHALSCAALAYAVSAAAWWWLPQSPLLLTAAASADTPAEDAEDAPDEAPAPSSTTDQDDDAKPDFDAEQAMYAQLPLLDAELAKLTPQTAGMPDLYVVAFAGDAQEDVFRNEAEYVEELFSRRFGAKGHIVVLENNVKTVTTRPLASWTNLHRALQSIAGKMDPAEDILLLYLSTHGSEDHQLLVDLDPLPLNQLGPEDIVDALKTKPAIRWKVVVVNACYSGGFVDALRDDSTMVMTSARADRTSFGCGADSDITYFGKAFLAGALNRTTSLREAFDLARTSVGEWESADADRSIGEAIEHSEPQIASSRSIEAKLAAWQHSLPPEPAVPFRPASGHAPGATAGEAEKDGRPEVGNLPAGKAGDASGARRH
jgi:hypothetical protein